MELVLERKGQKDDPPFALPGGGKAMITPPLDEDFWAYRVRLSETQAILGFPKFGTIGIGFAVEDDWNTNLPFGSPAEQIFDHISHNKADESISDADCIAAIELVREAASQDLGRPLTR